MAKRITKLERELALALDIASRLNLQKGGSINKGECNAWGNPSMFQDKINELLERAGRKAICPTFTHRRSGLYARPAPVTQNVSLLFRDPSSHLYGKSTKRS